MALDINQSHNPHTGTGVADHKEIYLQPECCADSETGRLWCEDDAPEECEDGKPWTRYIRADLSEQRIEQLEIEIRSLNEQIKLRY